MYTNDNHKLTDFTCDGEDEDYKWHYKKFFVFFDARKYFNESV